MFQKILVALDNSNLSTQAFDQAVSLAKALNAQLMLLHVLSPLESNYPQLPLVPGLDSYYPLMYDQAAEEYIRRWENYENQNLEVLKKRAEEAIAANIPTEFSQNTGDPGRVICAIARNWEADLIVMGRRGHSGLSEWVIGSTSNYVLHHAPCSVFVVQNLSDNKAGSDTQRSVVEHV